MTEEITKRFCPKCGKPVKGRSTVFLHRTNCPNPKCKQEVFFYEYPKARIPDAPQPYEPRLQKLILILGGTLAGLVLLAIIAVAVKSSLGVLVVALVAFAVAIAAIWIAAQRHDAASRLEHYRDTHEYAVQALFEASELANGFKKNYDSVVEDKLKEVRDEYFKATMHAEAVQTVTEKFVNETLKWSLKNVTPNNYNTIWKRVERNIQWCRKRGGTVSEAAIDGAKDELTAAFEDACRKAEAKEEQRLIREQMREEARVEREMKRALEEARDRETAIERAIEKALTKAEGKHSVELERLREQLAEAKSATERTKSRAQMTRAGHVYIISNIGSFGEGIFKVGMTRRLDPLDRVNELGDASVPFPFDVHAMLSSDDAPALESALHRSLEKYRVNLVNLRREFFQVDLATIIAHVERNHGTVEYVAAPEALQFRESLMIREQRHTRMPA